MCSPEPQAQPGLLLGTSAPKGADSKDGVLQGIFVYPAHDRHTGSCPLRACCISRPACFLPL